jgi:hypothetical protein
VKHTSWARGLSVTANGSGVVPLAGSIAVRLLADRVGLTRGLSAAVSRRSFSPVHDRGQVWVDVATMLTAGGEAISDIDSLRHYDGLLGPVASPPTVWRTLNEVTPAALNRVEKARSVIRPTSGDCCQPCPLQRRPVSTSGRWSCLMSMPPWSLRTQKEHAAATFKGGFGFHPLGAWCDNTQELLAVTLRPGNAGSNHAGDHIDVLTRAIAQVPAAHRRLEYSVGFGTKNTRLQSAIDLVPARAWTPAVTADGEVRDGADVAEVTGLVDLSGSPDGIRVIVRREKPHPGAQLSLFEHSDGWRYQAFATNITTGQLPFLEARHRAHARVEDRIRNAKDTGLGRFPSREYKINQAWLQIVAVAADLTAWLRLIALTGNLALAEPKLLRFRMLAVPARLTRGGPQRQLQILKHWPWAQAIVTAFTKIVALPAPT